ncbi:unnamed protein product [Closterium sp. NIES-53]
MFPDPSAAFRQERVEEESQQQQQQQQQSQSERQNRVEEDSQQQQHQSQSERQERVGEESRQQQQQQQQQQHQHQQQQQQQKSQFVSPSLVTTVAGFASSHRLDYAAHLVSGPARSPSSGGALVFPLEVLEDRQFVLGFLAANVPHLCAMLLALEGDLDALDIPIPRTHAEAVSGPWASYWIAAEEAKMASYRSTGTYVDAVPPPRANVVSGVWLYKVKRPPGAPPVFKARYVARGFSQREGVDFFKFVTTTRPQTSNSRRATCNH